MTRSGSFRVFHAVRAGSALVLGLSLAAFFTGLRAQDTEVIKISTQLVTVPVTVSDHNGRYIPNLNQANFQLFQDGTQQKIDFFAATEEPITVAILVDTSPSTEHVLREIKDSARSFLRLLRPVDRAMVVTFDSAVHVLTPLTADQQQLDSAITSAFIPTDGNGTHLRDAAYQTVNNYLSRIKDRKAIIMLTDGKDVNSNVTPSSLFYSLQETDTLIYTIMFKTDYPGPARHRPASGGLLGIFLPNIEEIKREQRRRREANQENKDAEIFLRQLSETTAGRFFTKKGRLKDTFDAILEELRFQYHLGFYPPDEQQATVHQLKVKVDRANAVVRSRASYRSQK